MGPAFRKVVLIFIIFGMMRVLAACCYTRPAITVQHYAYNSLNVLNLDNSRPEVFVSATDTIPKAAFGLRLDIGRLLIASRGSLFPEVFAQDCFYGPSEEANPVASIAQVSITSTEDFGELFPAGADLTVLFKVLTVGSYVNVLEYFAEAPGVLYDQDINTVFEVDLYLLTAPQNTGPQHFTVQITLSSGEKLSSTSPLVHLN